MKDRYQAELLWCQIHWNILLAWKQCNTVYSAMDMSYALQLLPSNNEFIFTPALPCFILSASYRTHRRKLRFKSNNIGCEQLKGESDDPESI